MCSPYLTVKYQRPSFLIRAYSWNLRSHLFVAPLRLHFFQYPTRWSATIALQPILAASSRFCDGDCVPSSESKGTHRGKKILVGVIGLLWWGQHVLFKKY